MKLQRIGANRKQFNTIISDQVVPRIYWSDEKSTICLQLRSVSDPSLSGQYDYEVALELRDIVKIVEELCTVVAKQGRRVG